MSTALRIIQLCIGTLVRTPSFLQRHYQENITHGRHGLRYVPRDCRKKALAEVDGLRQANVHLRNRGAGVTFEVGTLSLQINLATANTGPPI